MNRRKFLGSTLAAAASAFAAPYILPSGSLFAQTGTRRVNHVVFCLFAGGVRNIDTLHFSQAEGALRSDLGNLMPATLAGAAPGVQLSNYDPVPNSPLPQPLQRYGTLFREFRYRRGPTGHYNGHQVAITGKYTETGLNLRQNPAFPTIFEYYRKHNSPAQTAMNAWWISNTLGPYPALNYSTHPDYGPQYGANFLAPMALYNRAGFNLMGNTKEFSNSEERDSQALRAFLDANFKGGASGNELGMVNPQTDADRLRNFLKEQYQKTLTGAFNNPFGLQGWSSDVLNIAYALEVLKTFKPELLVVNMQDVDTCHQNFSQYCNYLRKADFAVANLWAEIQKTPGLMNDTVLIVAPEHGRNKLPNTVIDSNGLPGIDHTSDQTSREIFCLIVGPPNVIKQNQVVGSSNAPVGESVDIVMTIADLLGFGTDIPRNIIIDDESRRPPRVLKEAYV